MTKAQETALLQKWIAEAPADSYLATTLRHIAIQFENDTRSDFQCLPQLHEIERQIKDAEAVLEGRKRAIALADSKLADVENRHRNVSRMLADLKTTARKIADLQ